MGKKCLKVALTAAVLVVMSTSLFAQGAGDVLRYSLQYPSNDPVSLVMPGVSDATGFGSYQQNPATAALFKESFFSFDLSDRYVSEDGIYLENKSSFDDNQANLGDIGFVYNVPTSQGKLTVGAGYSQSHDFNRAFSGRARNNLSSITDFYASSNASSFLSDAAFNAFAIDTVTVNGSTQDRSIFRFPVGGDYPGINQNFNLTERGTLGEFSAFIATEFQKNFILGASIGVITGSYHQQRDFLESDKQGDYNSNIIQTDQGGSDIDRILSTDSIDDQFSGFSARLGFVYKITPHFNIGASYQFKNKITVNEDFSTDITTTLDNGVQFNGSDNGKIKYQVVRPARLNGGFTIDNLAGLTLSASAERVNYSDSRIRFDNLDLKDAEIGENSFVESNYEDVFNLRAGLSYQVNDQFTPRIGYAYYPSPTKNIEADRQFYSAGFSTQVSEFVTFNLGGQLGVWDDQATLYSSDDVTESITENVMHWHFMGGITYNF